MCDQAQTQAKSLGESQRLQRDGEPMVGQTAAKVPLRESLIQDRNHLSETQAGLNEAIALLADPVVAKVIEALRNPTIRRHIGMWVLVVVMFIFSGAGMAQSPVPTPPAPNPQLAAIQQQAESVNARLQLNYLKLSALQEFKEYLADFDRLQQLQQQYNAASQVKPPEPAPAPAKK